MHRDTAPLSRASLHLRLCFNNVACKHLAVDGDVVFLVVTKPPFHVRLNTTLTFPVGSKMEKSIHERNDLAYGIRPECQDQSAKCSPFHRLSEAVRMAPRVSAREVCDRVRDFEVWY